MDWTHNRQVLTQKLQTSIYKHIWPNPSTELCNYIISEAPLTKLLEISG